MMDASSSFSPARLNAIKGIPTYRGGIHPQEIATLLFEEAEDLKRRNKLRKFVDGFDRGVPIDGGRRTVPFSELLIPPGMKIIGVYGAWIDKHWTDAHYPPAYQDPDAKWGILALGCDTKGEPHWLWLTVWTGWWKEPPTCEELTVESLTELLTEQTLRAQEVPIPLDNVYAGFVSAVIRRMKDDVEIIALAQRSGERFDRIRRIMSPRTTRRG
jgi:hypothetical protein